jgi:hypothetical protein
MVRELTRSTKDSSFDDHLLGTEDSTLNSIQETNEHVKEARVLRPPLEADDDYTLAESKMRRALDRLKRAVVKVIDASGDITPSSDVIIKPVRILSMDIATTMEALLSVVGTVRDLVARVSLLPLRRPGIHVRGLRLIA